MIVSRNQAEEARALLEIAQPLGQFDADHVNIMFKLRAIQVHPDKGGTIEQFVAIDRAKHMLIAWLARAPEGGPAPLKADDCPACEGKGFIKVQRGFTGALRRQCGKCKGTGDLNYEHDNVGGD